MSLRHFFWLFDVFILSFAFVTISALAPMLYTLIDPGIAYSIEVGESFDELAGLKIEDISNVS